MATPIIEYIASNIETVLETITDKSVVRSKRIDFSDVVPDEDTILLVTTANNPAEGASNVDSWLADFLIETYVFDVSGDGTAIDARISEQASDIIKKLAVDVTRGNYALNTTVTGVDYFHDAEGCGGDITVQVLYRTVKDDPYTKA